MRVIIDIGNTTITIGLSKDGNNIDSIYRLNTEKNKSIDEYSILLKDFIPSCSKVIISSVVPELNKTFKYFFRKWFNIFPIFLGRGIKTGVNIQADNPKEVGSDLIGNAVAAAELYNETCLIVDMGTATTFTYLEKKTIKGIIITTGLTTSKNALIKKTSLLPQVELEAPKMLLGKNTIDCIKSGLIYGHASMIDGMITRIKNEVNNPNLTVIMTGGHSRIIHPFVEAETILEKRLILKGLLILLAKN